LSVLKQHFGIADSKDMASHLPQNDAIDKLPQALARAHTHYGKKE